MSRLKNQICEKRERAVRVDYRIQQRVTINTHFSPSTTDIDASIAKPAQDSGPLVKWLLHIQTVYTI